MKNFDGDPCHPILADPYSWEILEFTYRRDSADWCKSYIDLVFVRDGKERRLRFFAPRQVELPRGELGDGSRVFIVDLARRQMEDLGVRVLSYESDWCVPSFYAKSVVEVV